jgi:GAF domain-containing protein
VAKSTSSGLKLHGDDASDGERFEGEPFSGLGEMCDAFSAATGWPLRYESGAELRQDPVLKWSAPVNPGVGIALGHLRIGLGELAGRPTAQRTPKPAQRLAGQIANLLGELAAARRTVWNREAELAAGVPVVARTDEPEQLVTRLRSVLRAGAKACDCQAAALYMLDEGTSELKLRSAWGLRVDRLMQPARPLEGAMADLEALLGHAVALERASSFGPWHVPEEFPAALCVPVATTATPVGTLWLFSDHERDFTSIHTELAELTAGRLAAELERAMLITAQIKSIEALREIDAARRLQQSQWPQSIRLIDEGWELAGRISAAGQLSGAFYDWQWLTGDELAIAVGEANQPGFAGALTAAALRSAIRTQTEHGIRPGELLERLSCPIWLTSAGDESASLFFALLDLRSGTMRYSWAGRPAAFLYAADSSEIPLAKRPPLGIDADQRFAEQTVTIVPGKTLLLASRRTAKRIGLAKGAAAPDLSGGSLDAILESLAAADEGSGDRKRDSALLAVKRR